MLGRRLRRQHGARVVPGHQQPARRRGPGLAPAPRRRPRRRPVPRPGRARVRGERRLTSPRRQARDRGRSRRSVWRLGHRDAPLDCVPLPALQLAAPLGRSASARYRTIYCAEAELHLPARGARRPAPERQGDRRAEGAVRRRHAGAARGRRGRRRVAGGAPALPGARRQPVTRFCDLDAEVELRTELEHELDRCSSPMHDMDHLDISAGAQPRPHRHAGRSAARCTSAATPACASAPTSTTAPATRSSSAAPRSSPQRRPARAHARPRAACGTSATSSGCG